jgi:enoyl-CoA hydratase/carnithine racemase
MTSTTTSPVLVEDTASVRTITLNRPAKRNAIDLDLRVALADALEAADIDEAVRAIVITGAGPAFCSGGDISTMRRMPVDQAMERAQLAQRVIRAIWRTPKPVLAAVEGSAYGAGVALAAACDRVIAARDVRFATTFTNVGLAGDMGVFVSLPARVGVARARQMLMMATTISAPEALAIGLIDALVDPDEAVTAAQRDAAWLAERPPEALGVIKSMLSEARTLAPFDGLEREAANQATLFDTDDFAEGVAAFHEKRRPVFGSSKGAKA